jgi:uncharacterized membrane protein YhaH (DUF805 family)
MQPTQENLPVEAPVTNPSETLNPAPNSSSQAPLPQSPQAYNSGPPIFQNTPPVHGTPVQTINTATSPYPDQSVKPIKQQRINNITFIVIWALIGVFWNIIYFVIIPLLLYLGNHVMTAIPVVIGIIVFCIALYSAMLYLRACVYRLWDAGYSEPWIILLFVPVVGFGLMLFLMFVKSEPLSNRHGDIPLSGAIELKRLFH